mmetsp:Transcript_20054/g.25947  ORF Transcript_20054/g.25947 Transcript_20054/m.25947 type:complete len:120 (-) Transcript_20054:1095-1454(-)
MVVRMRLQRFGQRNKPFYRIVVANAKSPRDGRFIERVGTYNPIPARDGIKEVIIKSDRIKYWLACGAQPTKRVAWLLGKAQILPPMPTPVKLTTNRSFYTSARLSPFVGDIGAVRSPND